MGTRKYTINQNIFEKIDTEQKAYWLGFLYADGNVFPTQWNSIYVKIGLQEEDSYILENLRNLFETNILIKVGNNQLKNSKHKNINTLCISSYKAGNDLINKGCVPIKHNILQFPTQEIVPLHLLNHFIRGYFDGDGCVWDGKRKELLINDKTRKTGHRLRIIHNVKFTITGATDLIKGIQKYLILTLNFKENKLNFRNKNNLNCATLEYSGRQQMKIFYNFLYQNATIFLIRKKKKFELINLRANNK